MQLNITEISRIIKEQIEDVDLKSDISNQGTIVKVQDGIAQVHGLSKVMAGEMIAMPNATFGIALNLERDSVGVVVLGSYQHLKEGKINFVIGTHSLFQKSIHFRIYFRRKFK